MKTTTQAGDNLPLLLPISQAAKLLAVTPPTVYRLIRLGKIKTVTLTGAIRVVTSSLIAFVEGGAK